MGEYTGRRRGRAAPEPSPQEPEYPYAEEPAQQQPGYFQDAYAQPQPEAYGYEYYEQQGYEQQGYEQQYGYEAAPAYEQAPNYGYEYAPEYTQEPAYGYPESPSYEQHPSYEQYPAYEQQPGYEQYPSYEQHPSYEQQPGYAEDYAQEYDQGYYQEQPYYEQPYEEPPPVTRSRSRSSAPAAESYDTGYNNDYHPPAEPRRAPLSPLAHAPFIAASTAALAIAAFVSTKAVAAVVLPLQLVVAWAVLDLAGFASRRTAVVAALPALAGAVATFKFQADDAAIPVAAGLGAGFVLVAADAVLRARRNGVEPGTVRALAAAGSALLLAGLTGLFLPAAALHSGSVLVGAGVCGFVSLLAMRNPELAPSRAAVVAIPVTIAALASYAAAILVP